ncbi:MAG: site-specific DNA-methyltransferase [Anaerolineae bacterium]|nr:site-specific DNA-methyltransferase [Anaerolineae bacterium]
MPEGTTVEVRPAKGRPMLTWVGKRPLRQVTAFPAQHVESYGQAGALSAAPELWADWPAAYPRGGLLFHGDNKEVLAHLLANGFRGKVRLVYIDPPFDSGADYVRRVTLRGAQGTARFEGEGYTLGEQIQYTDIWANDNYLQFMYERLLLLRELLHDEAGIVGLQCDWRKAHHLRCLFDETFGPDNFRGEVLVRAGTKNVQSQFDEVSALATGHNSILLYSKSSDHRLPKLLERSDRFEPGKWDTFWRGTDRPTMRYELLGVMPSSGQWRWERSRAERAVQAYQAYLREYADSLTLDEYYLRTLRTTGVDLDFVRKDENGTVQYYVPPRDYRVLSNVWFDLAYRGAETGYPTEKHEQPVARLVQWLTNPGDIVLDCFIGSGTTAAVAQKLGRRWIGCDINKGAIQTTCKRLQAIIAAQAKALEAAAQPGLPLLEQEGAEAEPRPAQLSFTVYRVNDYDLQIQHNEAVNLACEHIGIARTRIDPFFEGTLGRSLVKIVPFTHPLTVADLEEIKRELSSRPEEERDVTVVCLGKELAAGAWLEEWNRLRRRTGLPNQIAVIELRTDPRYGRFFVHQPARARVTVERREGRVYVRIDDFLSPTIIERLKEQGGVLEPQIDDWRAMVDSVMIDPAHDGQVFNVALADVPERKTDLVAGEYELDAPPGETTVAVKITDMLGEEVVVTARV